MTLGVNTSTRTSATTYIRVVSLSIAFYDYLLTLPAEWRFYRSQRTWRLSLGCILFIAIRYVSMAAIVSSNVGFFASFTPEQCQAYYIAPPVLKVIQTMISQIILGIRTINISRRTPWVTWTIVASFVLFTAIEWFFNLWHRGPVQDNYHSCTAGNQPPDLTTWIYYLFAMMYDVLTLGISTAFLVSFGPSSGKMAQLVRIMLTDGLVYIVALTGVNILNVILYRSTDEATQSSGVSLGYALTWIMSQRILIHLRDAAAAHNRTITQVVVSRQLPSGPSISQAMRSQFESKDRDRLTSAFDLGDWSLATSQQRRTVAELDPDVEARPSASASRSHDVKHGRRSGDDGLGGFGPGKGKGWAESQSEGGEAGSEFELDVQVQVEEMVTVEYDSGAYTRESYRTPRVMWGRQKQQQQQRQVQRQEQEQGQGEHPSLTNGQDRNTGNGVSSGS